MVKIYVFIFLDGTAVKTLAQGAVGRWFELSSGPDCFVHSENCSKSVFS